MTAAEAIDVDEDEARIDALIEKFRAQEDPNIDEIQRELPPLLNSKESGRKEEKLVAFLKEVIAKVQSKQHAMPQHHEIASMQQYPPAPMRNDYHVPLSHSRPSGYDMGAQSQPHPGSYMYGH